MRKLRAFNLQMVKTIIFLYFCFLSVRNILSFFKKSELWGEAKID